MSDKIETAIYYCCREWVGPRYVGLYPPGRCGLCGEHPTYLRADPDSPLTIRPPIRQIRGV